MEGAVDPPRVLIMVLCSEAHPHVRMAFHVRTTWGAIHADNVRTVYYWPERKSVPSPGPGSVRMDGDDIAVGVPDGTQWILRKTLLAYRFVLEKLAFDFVFRVCSGSYVVPEILRDFCAGKPRSRVWCGPTGVSRDPTDHSRAFPFVSGSGMLMSRDVVALLADNTEEVLRAPFPGSRDDVSVGWFLEARGIRPDRDFRVYYGLGSDPIPGVYHYHYRTHWAKMSGLHSKISGRA